MVALYVHIGGLTVEDIEYIDANARARHISRTRLMARIIKVVCEDKMITNVLDDIDNPRDFPHEKAARPHRRTTDLGG